MRDQLVQYVSLLFAGAENCEDTKQEILQNTLDRYDDLIAEGKSPEAAYRLAITGIGDINEILGRNDTVLPYRKRRRIPAEIRPQKSCCGLLPWGCISCAPCPCSFWERWA